MTNFLDEIPIHKYLKSQKEFDNSVVDWTFTSPSLKYIFRKISPGNDRFDTQFSDFAGYKECSANIYSVQENFLKVNDLGYFIIDETNSDFEGEMNENGIKIKQLPYNLGIDPVQMLFADLPEKENTVSRNPFSISSRNDIPDTES